MPKVSVLIVTHNRVDDLLKCLTALYQQDYTDFEVVVVDNGSRDGSAKAIWGTFERLTVIELPKNYGDWEGRDIGRMNCAGEYLFSLDDDIIVQRQALGKLVEMMDSVRECAIIQAQVIEDNPALIGGGETGRLKVEFLGGAALYRTDVLARIGGFPHYLLGGAESHIAFRVYNLGMFITHRADALVYHKRSRFTRMPRQRLYCSSKYKLVAVARHYPGISRCLLECLCKLWSFTVSSARRGQGVHVPWGLVRLVGSFFGALRQRTPIAVNTLRILDGIRSGALRTVSDLKSFEDGRLHAKGLR